MKLLFKGSWNRLVGVPDGLVNHVEAAVRHHFG
jgi:hypothetical protein